MEPLESTDLRAAVRAALASTTTDQGLAAELVANGALRTVLETATIPSADAAQLLGIQPESVRKLVRKATTFPSPVVTGRRFATAEIQSYRDTHARAVRSSSSEPTPPANRH
ncbi:hypothetical protein CYJ75_12330 [Kocuria rhizophila]|uniref:hypothetical protein n=1 Tax=Kocuria rhizophila TaxID=72000 RepID=UPI000C7B6091|nr:hypothetical protein [Kocuria rhizophila]PKZ37056.1 hypothetical protein CYJ75_12330 [Kocuria rhizophila]